ncbi:MAG: hypothetical protein RIN55_10610 [Tissierellaceae bacterium]|nr:hypothetical protein [Tissierellaceae bacterium]
MLNDFIALESLGSFSIQLIIVVTSTEFTKKIVDKIKRNYKKKWKEETEYIVFLYALLLSILSSYRNYKINNITHHIIVSLILVFINSIVISYIASASYDKIIKSYEDRKLELEEDTQRD